MGRDGIRNDEPLWAEFGRTEFLRRFHRIEQVTDAVDQRLARAERDAAVFFADQDQRLRHVEKLVIILAEKGGATPEELAAVAAAVKGLDAESVALQSAADRANPSPPTKE